MIIIFIIIFNLIVDLSFDVIIDNEFLLFVLSGIIMFYGGIIGLGNTSPTISKLGNMLKLSNSKALTDKRINIGTQNSMYFFVLGIYLLFLSQLLSSLIYYITIYTMSLFD
jgi:hypothetical protein|tara:strand:+ start:85 stop:417 length:333 start_codon:yes stop_codon:yes gene_type:complete